jgi:hypothetical protein
MTTTAIETDVTAPTAPERRLGCTCESPEPRAAGSALCAQCGLVFLTSEEYAEHLARSRAAVEEMLARLTSAEKTTDDTGETGEDEESEPTRRWWRRERQPA